MNESFLRTYAKLNEDTEIPGIFAVWCGIAGLSAALGRRCWLDMGVYTIYPNLYIALVASSGRCRKSTSISIIESLLHQVEPKLNLISQKITPQALIEALRTVQINDEAQFLKESCVGFVIADEMNTFLNAKVYTEGLGSLLISLFDCKSHFAYHTRGRGVEMLSDSCLGILTGTTIDHLKDAMPKEAVGEGLTSRMIFIYCATPSKPVAITKRTKEQGIIEGKLIKFLQDAMALEGPVTLTQDAWDYYEKNYNKFYNNSPFYDISTLSGYASRRSVHLLKLSIIFAVSSRLSLNVEIGDIRSADEILLLSEKSMPMLLDIVTANSTGMLTQEILVMIKKAKKISRKKLMAKLYHKLDSKEFTSICETLVHSGCIKIKVEGNDLLLSAV